MNNYTNYHPTEALKRQRLDYHGATTVLSQSSPPTTNKLLGFSMTDTVVDAAAATIVPSVTVILEGRSICHRISLTRHASYESLAAALRHMFVDVDEEENKMDGVDLSNAVPGHLVAYEDMEDDLLLAGDLSWKDFVRVVKRIRIIPAKSSKRKQCRRNKM